MAAEDSCFPAQVSNICLFYYLINVKGVSCCGDIVQSLGHHLDSVIDQDVGNLDEML